MKVKCAACGKHVRASKRTCRRWASWDLALLCKKCFNYNIMESDKK